MARTRAVDYEDKRRHIQNTAASVFAELGFDRASMAEIARRGSISKALLYHYYESKDALIFDIVRTHLEDLEDAVERADRIDLTGEERLRLLIRAVIDNYEDADDKHKVQIAATNMLPVDQDEVVRTIERRIVRRFSAAIRQIAPDIDRERPVLTPVTMSIFGILNWIYMWFRPDGSLTRAQYAEVVTTMVLDGVRAVR
ncbi:MAG: TetR/AcrR family transcriptional regulator [Pseudomonadota bacterium]